MSAKTKPNAEKNAASPVSARPHRYRRLSLRRTRKGKPSRQAIAPRTIADLGWTVEDAARVRAQLSSFVEDWDDPKMDVYNEPAAR